MAFDLAQTHGWIVAELARGRPVAESMAALIDWCEAACPHPDWARLRKLPYADLSPLLEWIEGPFRDDPPAEQLKGLWFGLFNPCPDGRTPVADIYLCGSTRFDPDPDDNRWAVGPEWWPNGRYADSAVLADIYRIAYGFGAPPAEQERCLANDAEYPLVLGYGALAVRELLGQIDPSLVLGDSEIIGVAVGFDSGDFVLLGELTPVGMKPIDPSTPRPELPIEAVLAGLRSSKDTDVFRALIDLPRLGKRARVALPDLLRVANSPKFLLHSTAVDKLAAIAIDDAQAKAIALQQLNDASPNGRREALQTLISLKGLSVSDLSRIKDLENDADQNVARWSEIALRTIRLRDDADESNAAEEPNSE